MARIVHVITGLDVGGAEVQLAQLVERVDRDRYPQVVIALRSEGRLSDRVRAAGIELHHLGMDDAVHTPRGFVVLRRILRDLRPDVVQTWMYKADLIGGVAARSVGHRRLIWSVHQSSLDPDRSTRSNRLAAALGSRLSSRLPARILVVSEEAAADHRASGYEGGRMRVIPNGIDVDRFRPDPQAGASLRAIAGAGEGDLLVGCAARFDPQKDHATLARAFGVVHGREPRARLVLCGHGTGPDNVELEAHLRAAGVLDHTARLGVRDDMPRITAGFDVFVLSSAFGEGWSLAIGEAMASGVPCVVTDTGNSAWLVGDTGRAVPPRDAPALAAALVDVLAIPARGGRELGDQARRRIIEVSSLDASVRAYVQLWNEVAEGAPP